MLGLFGVYVAVGAANVSAGGALMVGTTTAPPEEVTPAYIRFGDMRPFMIPMRATVLAWRFEREQGLERPRDVWDTKVGGIEARQLGQFSMVQDVQSALLHLGQSRRPKRLQGSVHMDARKTNHVSEHALRELPLAPVLVGKADRLHARPELAGKVCEPLQGAALA